jgi:tetratricopeptide (TPR) repeat protein
LVAVLLVLWLGRKRLGRGPLSAVLMFGMLLGPTLGALRFQYQCHSYVANHFAYLACLPAIALLVGIADRRLPRAKAPIAGLAVLVLSGLTWRHAHIFADSELVWRTNVAANPGAWAARNNLGEALALRGRNGEAARVFEDAVRAAPDNPSALYNLGTQLAILGHPSEAADRLRAAMALQPEDPRIAHHLGNALAASGDFTGAAAAYERAIALSPDAAQIHFALGLVRVEQGRKQDAERHLRRALELDPKQEAARAALERLEAERR